jgi:hypothetical protein
MPKSSAFHNTATALTLGTASLRSASRLAESRGGRIARRDNHVDRLCDQLIDKAGKTLGLALGGAALEFDVAALDIPTFGEVLDHPRAEYAALGRAD